MCVYWCNACMHAGVIVWSMSTVLAWRGEAWACIGAMHACRCDSVVDEHSAGMTDGMIMCSLSLLTHYHGLIFSPLPVCDSPTPA